MRVNNDRLTAVWLALVGFTLASVALSERAGGRLFVAVVVFVVAIVKGQLIAVHFMETPRAPAWSHVYRAWIVVIGVVLMLGNVLAPLAR